MTRAPIALGSAFAFSCIGLVAARDAQAHGADARVIVRFTPDVTDAESARILSAARAARRRRQPR
jgi:hypothetical protein